MQMTTLRLGIASYDDFKDPIDLKIARQ